MDNIFTYPLKLKIKNKNENTDTEILRNNPFLKNNIIKYGKKGEIGLCFNYALSDFCLRGCEDSYNYIVENYKNIPITKAKKGDIVIYRDSEYEEVLHFAIIEETNGTIKNTIIKSKWGELGIYKTKLEEVLDIYGNYCEIWTKKIK